MKKLAVTLCFTALAAAAFAQGTVNPANTAGTTFRTNGIAQSLGSGTTSPTLGGFMYEVLTAPSTVTSINLGSISASWSDTGLSMTNTAFASGGRMNGPSGAGGVVNNWAAGVSQSYIVVGWSTTLGSSWSTIAAELNGAQLIGGQWVGGTLANALAPGINGFLGSTTIQQAVSGQATGVGAFSLFGTTGTAAGTPVSTPTDLFVVQVPEPTSFALAGLGMAAGLVLRRRK